MLYKKGIYVIIGALIGLVCTDFLNAQFTSSKKIYQSELSNITDVALSDVNQDGSKDILVASAGNSRIVWYENSGTGNFGDQQIISDQSPAPTQIIPIDYDKDGDQDLLTVFNLGESLLLYENTPEGFVEDKSITVSLPYPGDAITVHVEFADITGNGYKDIVYTNSVDILYHENTGNGFSDSKKVGEIGPEILGLTAADYEKDGFADIVVGVNGVSESPGHLALFQNDSAKFSNKTVIADSIGEPKHLLNSDINGDEKPDLVASIGLPDPRQILILKNNDYDLQNAQQDTFSIKKEVAYLEASDVDGDGDRDLAGVRLQKESGAHNTAGWYENKNGNFETFHAIDQGVRSFAMDVGNISGDELPELVVGLEKINNVRWFRNVDGSYPFSNRLSISTISHPSSIVSADVDSDKDQDLVFSSHVDGKIMWLEKTENGFGAARSITRSGMIHNFENPIQLFDINGDGQKDLVTTRNNGNLVWYRNADGTFENPVIIDKNSPASEINIVDVNRDGQKDIVTIKDEDFRPDVILYKHGEDDFNNSSSSYKYMLIKDSDAFAFDFAHLNQDSRLEMVVSSNTKTSWFELRGDTVGGEHIIGKEDYVRALDVTSADLNNDGNIDVVVSDRIKNNKYYLNDEKGNFQLEGKLAKGGYTLKSAHLDRDSTKDLVQVTGGPVFWYDNQNLSFKRHLVTENSFMNSPIPVNNLEIVDVEQDGDNDIVLASAGMDAIRLFRNSSKDTPIEDEPALSPSEVRLNNNYPNPFNPSTNIQFELPKSSHVTLKVYNTLGQQVEKVLDKKMNAGTHQVTFSADGLSSGAYIYRLKVGNTVKSRKMLLVK